MQKSLIKVNNKDTRVASNDVVLESLLSNFNIFHIFFSVSIINFEQVNVFWKHFTNDAIEKLILKNDFPKKCRGSLLKIIYPNLGNIFKIIFLNSY